VGAAILAGYGTGLIRTLARSELELRAPSAAAVPGSASQTVEAREDEIEAYAAVLERFSRIRRVLHGPGNSGRIPQTN
jgi:hypothetical protein